MKKQLYCNTTVVVLQGPLSCGPGGRELHAAVSGSSLDEDVDEGVALDRAREELGVEHDAQAPSCM